MVNAQDARIMGAYSLFREDGDKNDLIDSLFRLSRVSDANKANANIQTFSATKPTATAATTTSASTETSAPARPNSPMLTVDERGQVIDILVKANALTQFQVEFCKKNFDDNTL